MIALLNISELLFFLIKTVILISINSNSINKYVLCFFMIRSSFGWSGTNTFCGKILFVTHYFHLDLVKLQIPSFRYGQLILYRRLFKLNNQVHCMSMRVVTSFGVNNSRTSENIGFLKKIILWLLFWTSPNYCFF